MKSRAWVVTFGGKYLDTGWSQDTDPQEVYRSLVNHDGYDPRIKVGTREPAQRIPHHTGRKLRGQA